MSTKILTNNGENTLINKFKGVFNYTSLFAFDAFVGYFRSSGYFRIRPFFGTVDSIRILVGIDVDHLISKAAKKGLEVKFNTDVTCEEHMNTLKEDIKTSDYSKEVEDGILQCVYDIIIPGKGERKSFSSAVTLAPMT